MYAPRIVSTFGSAGIVMPDGPNAINDTVTDTLDLGETVTITPLTNDTGTSIYLFSVDTVTGGSASKVGDSISYTAPATPGDYTIGYTIKDSYGRADSGTISVKVQDLSAGTDPDEPPISSMTVQNIASGTSWADIQDILKNAVPGTLYVSQQVGAINCNKSGFSWAKSGTSTKPIGFMAKDIGVTELKQCPLTLTGSYLFVYGFKMTGRGHNMKFGGGDHCAIHRLEITGWGPASLNMTPNPNTGKLETASMGVSFSGGPHYWLINRCHIHHQDPWDDADLKYWNNDKGTQLRMGIRCGGKALNNASNPFPQHGAVKRTKINDMIARVVPGSYGTSQTDPIEVGEDAGTYSYENNMDILLEDMRVLDCHDPNSAGAIDIKAPGITFRRLHLDNPNAANKTPRMTIRAYGHGKYFQCYTGPGSNGCGLWGGYNELYGCRVMANGKYSVGPGNSPHDWDHGYSYYSYDPAGNPSGKLVARINTTNACKGTKMESCLGRIEVGNSVSSSGFDFPADGTTIDTNCTGPIITQTPGYSWDDGDVNAYRETNTTHPTATKTHVIATKDTTPESHVGPTSTWYPT